MKAKVWILTVNDNGSSDTAVGVHATEADAMRSLRENYDDIGEFAELEDDVFIEKLWHVGIVANLDWDIIDTASLTEVSV